MKKDYIANFWKAKAFTQAIELGAAGWNIGQHDPEIVANPMVYLYAYDPVNGWIWASGVNLSHFVETSEIAQNAPSSQSDYRSALTHTIYCASTGNLKKMDSTVNWENLLAILITCYAGSTKSWKLANHMRDGGHFIVLSYRQSDYETSGSALLRPVVVPKSEGGCLDLSELKNIVQHVQIQDRNNHPEWFF